MRSHHGFLGCHDCQLLSPVIASDGATQDDQEAYREFAAAHGTHHTALLSRPTSETWSDRPLWDPLATISFEVSDGARTCVVHASRQSIDEPRIYRFQPGSLTVTNVAVDLDEALVRRGLDLHFYPHAVRPTKLDRFMTTLHDVVDRIAPTEIEIAFDVADDPTVSIGCIPDDAYQVLTRRCADIFDAAELSRVSEFLLDNRFEDGLLALRVRRNCSILTS